MSGHPVNQVSISRSEHVAVITLDHAPKNLLNPTNMRMLVDAIQGADRDQEVQGIILTGAGDYFCGGLDVPAIQAGADPVEFAESLAELLLIFPALETPITAAVNGDAVASGASIVAAVDFAIGNPGAHVGTYEVSVGIWPMIAQVPLIKRIGARAAMENIGAGQPFTAQRAFEVGLLQGVVEPGAEVDSCHAWLALAARGTAVYAAGRRSLYELSEMHYADAVTSSLNRFTAMFR